MGIPYGRDDFAFFFSSRLFSSYIKKEIGLGSYQKRIPNLVFNEEYPNSLRETFFESLMLGDGSKANNEIGFKRYNTTSEHLKNDFVKLCLILGKTIGKITKDEDNCWRISLRRKANTVKHKNISIVKKTCNVYCFTLDKNHIVFAGRNGKYNWIGQCDSFDLENSHVIPAMIRKFHEAKLANAPDVVLWGDGSPTREFLYVEDCARAFIDAMERYDGPEPINIGSGKEISMKDLANTIKEVVRYDGQISWDTSRPNGQPRRCLDVSRAKKLLGWEATTEFVDGLRKTYEWYLSNS